VGYQALDAITTGGNNTAIGFDALSSLTTTQDNVALGAFAAQSATGTGNIFLGESVGSSATSGDNCLLIGRNVNKGAATNSNEMVIATAVSTSGKGSSSGFMNPNGGGMFQGNNNSSWSTSSDQRLKKNIVDNIEGLEKIVNIRVRNFEYRLPEEVDPELKPTDAVIKSGVQLGVIAQELQQVCPDCVTEQSTGVLSVDTDEIFWHMVNAIKELSAQVTALQAEVNALKGQ
jgi:hypothetical protein